jgi:hypothetical protein
MFKWLTYAVKWMVSVKRKIAMSSNHTRVVDSEEETKSEKKFFHFQHQVDVLCVFVLISRIFQLWKHNGIFQVNFSISFSLARVPDRC